MEKVRLQKYIADCGIMSRRAAENEILKGNISVNGKEAQIGRKIAPGNDIVRYNGKIVKKDNGAHNVYIMLNKPKGYVTTLSDEKGRHCIAELISDVKTRVYPVGRLDMASEGLLILTNDGKLTNILTHPKHNIPKIYKVKVKGKVTGRILKQLCLPTEIDGYTVAPSEWSIISEEDTKTVLSVVLYEGRNRQIRKMAEKVGLVVLSLKRTAIGKLEIGNLPRGKWVYLTDDEVKYLYGEREDVENSTNRR